MATDAIQSALALFREPGRIADFRDRPLPADVGQVIRVAAGEAAAVQSAREATEESAETLAEACIFYLQQMLFVANADSYRVLGLTADAPQQQLREHYRWLMRWLHPDRNPDGWEVVYADRVNAAWQDVKTQERRAQYDVRAPADSNTFGSGAGSLGAPIRIRPHAPDAHRPFLSGAMVRRLPAIIFGALSVSALAVLGLMYWAQVDSQREIEMAAQRANGSVPPVALGDTEFESTMNSAVASVQESLVPLPSASEPSAVSAPVQTPDPAVEMAPPDPAIVAVAADQVTVPVAEAPIDGLPVVSEPLVESALSSVEPAPALIATVSESAVQPAAVSIDPAPPIEPTAIAKEPLPEVTTTPTPVVAVVPAPMPVSPAQATVPPATVPLAIATPDPVVPANENPVMPPATPVAVAVAPVTAPPIAEKPALVSTPPVPTPPIAEKPVLASASPVPAPPIAEKVVLASKPPEPSPPAVAIAKQLPIDREADAESPALPPAVPPPAAVPVSATADAVVAIAPSVPPMVEPPVEPVVEPAVPPARNDAQKLVGEMASAYASGNLARFDKLFVQSSAAGAGGMRNRMQSTQMRYLEMGEVDWSLTHDSAVGRVTYRDTFVPRGAKKAVTQAGEIHLIVRVDSGRARISSLEVASIAN